MLIDVVGGCHKELKGCITLYTKAIAVLRSVTYHMESPLPVLDLLNPEG